jgi:hypothetical protein
MARYLLAVYRQNWSTTVQGSDEENRLHRPAIRLVVAGSIDGDLKEEQRWLNDRMQFFSSLWC